MLKMNRSQVLFVLVAITFCVLIPSMAFAGTTGTEFQNFFDKILGYAGGYLGKGIALVAFVIGLGVGAARANPIPAVAGIVFALFVAIGPDVITSIASATV